MKSINILLIILFALTSYASPVGSGCSKNETRAVELAVADLAAQVHVRVESELNQFINSKGVSNVSYKVRISSELPVFAYESKIYTANNMICADVWFGDKSAQAYKSELSRAIRTINIKTAEAGRAKSDKIAVTLYNEALSAFDNYEKYAVALLFMGNAPAEPDIFRAEIEAKLIELQNISSDIEQIAENIKEQLSANGNFYVHPPKLIDSEAVTPFASVFKAQMGGIASSAGAKQHLFCVYEPNENIFILSCRLTDNSGKTVETAITAVSGKICDKLSCYASANMRALEEAFKNNINTEAGFSGYFYTNYGTPPLLLKEGDVIRLYSRINRPAEYILLWVSPERSAILKRGSINAANAEEEIAALKVTQPFGSDALVFFAHQGEANLPAELGGGERALSNVREALKRSNKPFIEKSLLITTEAAK